ncbi:MAG: gliding motility-associated C-terminal domain-containing protein [Bacteroidia bacterium]|nr:gliding motility-associated C-terminal domain-containing protein [Bacteroidia bacterium]
MLSIFQFVVKSHYLYLVVLLIVMLNCCIVAIAPAQGSLSVNVGQTTEYSVTEQIGNSYLWAIYDGPSLINKVNASQAIFTSGNSDHTVFVKWGKPGLYYVVVLETNASGCANTKASAVNVSQFDLSVYAGKDTTIGACTSIVLNGSSSIKAGVIYHWFILGKNGSISNPGILNPVFTPDAAGDYKIVLTSSTQSGVAAHDTVVIAVDKAPVSSITQTSSNDLTREIILDGSSSIGKELTYQWFTTDGLIGGSDILPQLKAKKPGVYTLVTKDSYGCVSTKSFKAQFDQQVLNANNDFARTSWIEPITINVLENDYLTNGSFAGASFNILEQAKLGIAQFNANGTVTYTSTEKKPGRDRFIYQVCTPNNLCDSAVVTIDITDPPILIPEGISPNGDGVNDRFEIKGLEKYPKSKVAIYTRSGNLVYQSDNYQSDWDGTSKNGGVSQNQFVPTGVYYYVLKLGENDRTIKGNVYVAY